ncbi:Prokineticin receptor 2 [Trichoplax sp. H2]|nr:Prokineticin receptor 2 [Trichoplax sp. H2]|eukprot:RDD39654.1 Prokineticin receptor 2 [Trichoplax sp. H2]
MDHLRISDRNPTSININHTTIGNFPSVQWIQFYVGLAGLIANFTLLLLISTSRKGLKDKSYVFINNIALSDFLICFLMCLMHLPFKGSVNISISLGGVICKILFATFHLSFNTSAYSLTFISMYRLKIVIHPLSYRVKTTLYRHTKIVAVAIWIFSLVIAIPNIFLSEVVTLGLFCDVGYPYGQDFNQIYYTIVFTISSIVPILVMSINYIRIAKALSCSVFSRPSFARNTTVNSKRTYRYRSKNVVEFLICTTGVYMFLSLPFLIGFLIMSLLGLSFHAIYSNNDGFRIYMIVASSAFISVTIFNPILFLFCDRNIRLQICKKRNHLYYFILSHIR